MQTEFFARGLSDLNDAGAADPREALAQRRGVHEIDGLADWPYKLASTTGTAPLTIADLDVIEAVTDVGNPHSA
jgi:hypothetical protein